jgi:hypothetical protein
MTKFLLKWSRNFAAEECLCDVATIPARGGYRR